MTIIVSRERVRERDGCDLRAVTNSISGRDKKTSGSKSQGTN
jgi:hypothetical protein